MKPGIYPDVSESDYFSSDALSSTGARRLLESPAKFRYLQDHPEPAKDAYSLGTALHTKVLGTGATVITYPDEHLTPSGAVSTSKKTVEWAETKRAEGFVLVGSAQATQVDGMTEAVLAHPEARHILETVAGREVSLFTEIDSVPVRARFDIYDGTAAGDLKSARDASPKGFNAAVGRYGYHIQDRFYAEAHTAITGTELESFRFLVVESAPPHLVGVYDLDYMWEDIAKERVQRARDLYRQCTQSGVWPGYPSGTLTPPTWAVFDADEQEIQL